MSIHWCTAPSATLPGSRLLPCNNGRISSFWRPLPVLRTQKGPARARLVVANCAGNNQPRDDPSPEPEEDPLDADSAERFRRRSERLDKFTKEYGAQLRAQYGSSSQQEKVAELELTLFRDEKEKALTYVRKIVSNRSFLYKEGGRKVALQVGLGVLMAIRLSNMITANAHLRVDGSSEISFHTVEQIIQTYVSSFLKLAEDVWNRKVENDSRIISFLGALGGLAAISHIMLEDALAAVNTSEQSLSNYIPKQDIEALNHELQHKMKNLERKIMVASKTSDTKVYELLAPTLNEATDHVSLFVIQMTHIRARAIAHAQARAA
ncbi:hypothetical protein EJB05_10611 [Eragrostis curvula]|uniref:Uncharacterized protein n=1 Tax=Eragrostis curvula TaxID=38414 RepID=A0A5J9VLJ7_9POAL|nr:hypothetical protein EJB05_10611 [Eragrostis curvula]